MKNLPPNISFSQLKAAFVAAMKAPYPHDRSPALPLQVIYEDTKFSYESDDMWIERCLRMKRDDYEARIGRDIQARRWSTSPDVKISGAAIMTECAEWHKNGWDFSRHPRGSDEYPEDYEILNMDPRALKRIEASLMPIPGEVIRRSWYQKHGADLLLCHFDVWRRSQSEFGWCHSISAEKEIEISSGSDEFWKIEGFIAPSIVSETAVRSFLTISDVDDRDEDLDEGEDWDEEAAC